MILADVMPSADQIAAAVMQAAEKSGSVPPWLMWSGGITSMAFVCWYAWYNASRVIPALVKDWRTSQEKLLENFRADLKQLHVDYAMEKKIQRDAYLAESKVERDLYRDDLKQERESRERTSKELADAIHGLEVAVTGQRRTQPRDDGNK